MFILIYLCLPEADLKEGQSYPRPHIPATSEYSYILGYLLSYALILLLSVNFALAHETICILYLMVRHTTPQPSNLYTIG